MYQHVIVPFDGEVETRAVLAPAADLAWRCKAKLVIVTTTSVHDESVQVALKAQAIAKSGADVDFWVDLDRPLDQALLEAARHRPDSIICVTSRHRQHGRRRRPTALPDAVMSSSEVPVVVIGPGMDVTGGLPMTDVYLVVGTVPAVFRAARLAAEWGRQFRLGVHLVAVAPPGSDEHAATEPFRRLLTEVAKIAPDASLGVLESSDPASAFIAMVNDTPNAVVVLPAPDTAAEAPLGDALDLVVNGSTRPVLIAPIVG